MKHNSLVLVSGVLIGFSPLMADDIDQSLQPIVPVEQPTDMPAAVAPAPQENASAAVEVSQWKPATYTPDAQGDEARGDWYKKRKILQQARAVHERIHQVVTHLDEIQQTFIKKYEPAVLTLKQSVNSFGFSLNDVQTVSNEINESIQKYTQEEGARNEVDRQKLIDLQDSKKIVDEFKEEFKYLVDLYESLNKALEQLKSQVAQSNEYEQNAWKNYETIDEVFNDLTASRLLDEMRAYLENVEMIEAYISNDLDKHCQTMIARFDEQVVKVKGLLGALTQHNIVFKKEAQDLISSSTQQASAVDTQEKTARISWWAWIGSFFVSIWKWFMSFFR